MTERPIIFSAPEVQAILGGRKTQTRRVVNPQPGPNLQPGTFPNPKAVGWYSELPHKHGPRTAHSPPCGAPGTRLWVRETWAYPYTGSDRKYVRYKAGNYTRPANDSLPEVTPGRWPWKSSILMPRWASRLTLEVVSVRVERLQDISEADARAEGCNGITYRDGRGYMPPERQFREQWDQINGKRAPWDANPWVFAIAFRRVER